MIVNPPNAFWIEHDLEPDMMIYLWSMIDKANVSYKSRLLGHISNSLELPDTEGRLEDYLKDKSKELSYIPQNDLWAESLWVNFQKKHEFNPFHIHSGVLSFVIWMKIPYDYEDEKKLNTTKDLTEPCRAGCFEFLFTDIFGRLVNYSYHLSPKFEGKLILFPAMLSHQVYPFYTSDQTRISISGNLNGN